MEWVIGILLVVCVVAIALATVLWRRGAIKVDRERTRQEVDEALEHMRADIRNWRDKLDKK